MRSFLSLMSCSQEELFRLLDRADELQQAWQERRMPQALAKQRVGLWFYGQGFRNRVAFELGARSMGADVSYVPGDLGVQEPLEDMGAYLGNWYDLLVVRARWEADLLELTDSCGIPVVNARTDRGHPCEIMGDLQYVRGIRGSLEGLKVVFLGEVTNLGRSWLEAANRFPIRVTQVAPEAWLATDEERQALCRQASGDLRFTTELDEALQGAEVIYTDCWPKAEEPEEKKHIRRAFLPYQVQTRHLNEAGPSAIFLPCPPVTRGEEVSSDAMHSPQCRNHAAKACLLHAQNAILEFLMQQDEHEKASTRPSSR
jgi:ornithine carbamoyltransferase